MFTVSFLLVLEVPMGELNPSQRVLFVGDLVWSISAVPTDWPSWEFGAAGLRPVMPFRWWQPARRLAGGVETAC